MDTFRGRAALLIGVVLCLLLAPVSVASAAPAESTSRTVQRARGDFTATVDFASLVVRPVRPDRCEFTVNGTLEFTETLVGTAPGTTTALIFAPCSQATTSPPGTFPDVFRFVGTFTGTVAGRSTSGPLTYAGVTRAGGDIDATVLLDGDRASAVLHADAVVAVGGSYRGVARTG